MPLQCRHEGCAKIPVYGAPGTKEGLYCVAHKRADDVDVKHARCRHEGCAKRPAYGAPGTEPDRCREHIKQGMIQNPRRRCEHCNELGIWGLSVAAAERRCDAHRAAADKNLIEGRCASCGLEYVLSKAGTCQACGEHPLIKRAFLEKQRRVAAVLSEEFKVESYDKMLDGGICSRKRPDFVIDGLYRKLVIEVDEHQHRRSASYGEDCEIRRMWDIAQALGGATTFIRYNPDKYVDGEGRHADPPGAERERALVGWIKTLQEREAVGVATAIYLYYDGFARPEKAEEGSLPDPYGSRAPHAPSKKPAATLTDADMDELFAGLGG